MKKTPTRKARQRRQPEPDWVSKFLETGQAPEPGDEGRDKYIGWLFFGEQVPGLPDVDSPQGRALAAH